jgi:excinuclease ABC subunit B
MDNKPKLKFKLESSYKATGDQPEAINKLVQNISQNKKEQVLVGVTGSGKTFTMANVINRLQKPALIISHNKTLAAQLYQEFRDFFPTNAVSYFVSYYDYYQPEAYIPHTDTYIEKETDINEEIDKLRLAATANILTRPDTIVVASVSSIYNIGSPREYGHFVLELKPGIKIIRESILERLIQLQYERNDYGFHRSTFRVRGDTIDIFPAYEDTSIRIVISNNIITELDKLDPLTGNILETLNAAVIYPAKHYMTDPTGYKEVFELIRSDLEGQVSTFKKEGKLIEAQRINQRVNYDLEMIQEMGYVNGIENYSRYFDGRAPGSPPYSLFDYFSEATGNNLNNWLLFIDESHMTIPQIRGMYNGDRSRKQTLIDYGFRLPAALDNRPLRFDEFMRKIPKTIYVSATPNDWEMTRDGIEIVEQLVRPTGLIDPEVQIKPRTNQIDDLINEIKLRKEKNERILVTTLTKRMAEDLTKYMEEKGILVQYLHSDILTLERTDILADLRNGKYDVIIGVNLLREGLDLPEVSLVAILDADKEGFLRSRISLIQTMGRAARHLSGKVILYADTMTNSMSGAIEEVTRRRQIQIKYNKEHGITPESIQKPIRDRLTEEKLESGSDYSVFPENKLSDPILESMTPIDRNKQIVLLTKQMREASRELNFEYAAHLRDVIVKLKNI